MANMAKHAFGKSASIDEALQANKIDAYDILFLDSDTEPKVGWIDKNGNKVIAEGKTQVVRVETLPVENGDEGVIYIFQNEAYVWDGSKCVALAKTQDLSALEAEIAKKIDEATVDSKIASSMSIVEF